MNNSMMKQMFAKSFKYDNAHEWGKNLKEVYKEFGYVQEQGGAENCKMVGFGATNLDLEWKIQNFEFNHGPLDLVSKHVRRVGDKFKKSLYS